MELDDTMAQTIREIEAFSEWPTGIGRISRGECPLGAVSPAQCTLCIMGHMLECHYPHTCSQCGCGPGRHADHEPSPEDP
jgi:hypothetical protein